MAPPDRPTLLCPYLIWWRLFRETPRSGVATVTALIFYDDIDPGALSSGIVRLSGHAMNAVWETCADRKLEVLADIHTHPGGAGQSRSDREHPMVSVKGHLALIAPRFARSAFDLAGVGAYRYRGSKLWDHLPAPRPSWLGVKIQGA
jgi:hypothetical protein